MANERVILRAKVTKVTAQGAYVEVPAFGTGLEYGPLEVNVMGVVEVGDRVVVGQVADVGEDYVVLAKVANTGEPLASDIASVIGASAVGEYPAFTVLKVLGDQSWAVGLLDMDNLWHLVATSGEFDGAKLVKADDVRLSDARTPVAHNHTNTTLPVELVYRINHGSNAATARPSYVYIEWVGSVYPNNMGPNDTWVNTAL